MTVIEALFNNDIALQSMFEFNPLHPNDMLWHYQIVIFVKVVNDAAPWYLNRDQPP